MLEKVRRLLGEQADSNGDYSQAVWTDQFLLDGLNQAMDRCTRAGFWFYRDKDTTLTTVSGTNRYSLATPNLQSIESVYVGTLSSENQYAPISAYDFDNLLGGQYYKIEADADTQYLYLYPTPTQTGSTIYLRGIERATQLSSADTTVRTNLPDHYHMFLVWSAVVYARYREEEISMKREAEREAEDIWENLWMNEIAPGGQQGLRFKHPLDVPR